MISKSHIPNPKRNDILSKKRTTVYVANVGDDVTFELEYWVAALFGSTVTVELQSHNLRFSNIPPGKRKNDFTIKNHCVTIPRKYCGVGRSMPSGIVPARLLDTWRHTAQGYRNREVLIIQLKDLT